MGQQQGDRRGLGTVDNRGASGTQGPPQSGQLKPLLPSSAGGSTALGSGRPQLWPGRGWLRRIAWGG
jgi:hypothetical protein